MALKSITKKLTVRPFVLIILISCFVVTTGNFTFFNNVADVYPLSENVAFLISLTFILLAVTIIVTTIMNFLMPVKLAVSTILLISVFAGYFADMYGTVINVDMIRNSLESNTSEANDLLSFSMLIRVFVLGILPVALVYWLPVNKEPLLRDFKLRGKQSSLSLLACLGVICLSLVSFSSQYASFFREHKPLRYYINPVYPIYSTIKFTSSQFASKASELFVYIASFSEVPDTDLHRELVILVVGETARADHFSLNDYPRTTNPLLQKEERLISFSDISSCGTSTAISVPCMFSRLGRDNFNVDEAKYSENVLDLVNNANISVIWRDNNSDSKHVADRIPFFDFKTPEVNTVCDDECRDTGMLDGLQQFIDAQEKDILIVLHQMGSHGPAYYKRYPKEFNQFTPACETAELSECSEAEIINAYDNTILYTDYFLSEVIGLLKTNTPKYETAMIYVSDHGESLGENGIYLHGLPYVFAPDAQKKVPIIMWVGESSDIDFEGTKALKDTPNSHDALAQAILTVMEVDTDAVMTISPPLLKMLNGD